MLNKTQGFNFIDTIATSRKVGLFRTPLNPIVDIISKIQTTKYCRVKIVSGSICRQPGNQPELSHPVISIIPC